MSGRREVALSSLRAPKGALGLQGLPRDPFPGHQNPQESSVLPAPGRLHVIFQHFPGLVLTLVHSPPLPCVPFPGFSPALPSVSFPLCHRLLSWGMAAPAAPMASCFLRSIRITLDVCLLPLGWKIRVGSAGLRGGVTARP